MQLVGSSICIHEHSLGTVTFLTLSLFNRKYKQEVKRRVLKEEGIAKGSRDYYGTLFHYNTILGKTIEKQYVFEHVWEATREIGLVYLVYRYDYLWDTG